MRPVTEKSLLIITKRVSSCRKCPRLVTWREEVATKKRAAYDQQTYWGKGVPGFGDPKARILIVGLAPAAHGANRTGRMFTGDRSGDWLYGALHRAGLANQSTSTDRNDGLVLKDTYITAIVRCAPPKNRPEPKERDNCLPYWIQELNVLTYVQVLIALGGFAWNGILKSMKGLGVTPDRKLRFSHGSETRLGKYRMIGSYHPSQQNTFTRKLTEPMFDSIFQKAKTRLTTRPEPAYLMNSN